MQQTPYGVRRNVFDAELTCAAPGHQSKTDLQKGCIRVTTGGTSYRAVADGAIRNEEVAQRFRVDPIRKMTTVGSI
jgi:hypothetical protein